MPRDADHGRPTREPPQNAERVDDSARLLRLSHIFSSAVREILELGLLHEVSPHPLTLSQFHVLKLMSFNGVHQVGDVAEFLGVSPPAATKNIDKLERYGLVVRKPSAADRRATELYASAKGRRLVKSYEQLKADRLIPVFGEFETDEIGQLASLLERFSVSLLQLGTPDSEFCLRCAAYIESGCPVGEVRGGCPFERTKDKS